MESKKPVCHPDKLLTPDHIHQSWCLNVGPEVKRSDVLSPWFWRNAKLLAVHDLIEVFSENFDALLRVTVAGENLVVVRPIYITEVAPPEAQNLAAPDGSRVEFLPGKKRWRAVAADGTEISSGHASREEAALAARAA